ncbi:MAG TPA: hypothetical protein VF637_07910 [Sphingomicrobium sp.]|jgi:hypothetical protein
MNTPKLKQDADRARRMIGWLNDEQSVRTLRRYAEELEEELLLPRTLPHGDELNAQPEDWGISRLPAQGPDHGGQAADQHRGGEQEGSIEDNHVATPFDAEV